MRAAGLLERYQAEDPDHPGVLHYLLHAYDDPAHAPLGLRAAALHPGVAPASAHAQHMPAHIFLRTGRWAAAIEANESAYAVSKERREREGLSVAWHDYHSMVWLEYAYLDGFLEE